MTRAVLRLVLCAGATATTASAQGHGPIFGLATPTLGAGGWSLDVATMGRLIGQTEIVMLRPMVSYGITEDVQVSASLPMPVYVPTGLPPAHGASRMSASPDVEFVLGWRFHRQGLNIGSRFESTAFIGFDYPTDAVRAGVKTAPGVYGALATGFASRTIYTWVGGLYRRYMTPIGATADHPGDVAMYSVVLGYRPPPLRQDYPHPDWRVFLEGIGEYGMKDVIAGVVQPGTGGHQVFLGPTLLGLYGSWGISGGPVFSVYRQVNGAQPRERTRLALNTTFWF